MKLRFLTLFLLVLTVVAFGQDVKPPVPPERPLSMENVRTVMREKSEMMDSMQLEIARKDDRIAQLIAELNSRVPCSTTAKPEAAAKSGGR